MATLGPVWWAGDTLQVKAPSLECEARLYRSWNIRDAATGERLRTRCQSHGSGGHNEVAAREGEIHERHECHHRRVVARLPQSQRGPGTLYPSLKSHDTVILAPRAF